MLNREQTDHLGAMLQIISDRLDTIEHYMQANVRATTSLLEAILELTKVVSGGTSDGLQ